MTGLEVAGLVTVAVWLSIVTLVLVLVVRQIALLTVRLENSGTERFSLADDGLEVGSTVPASALSALALSDTERAYLLLLSSTCLSCREIAPSLEPPPDFAARALLPGKGELPDAMARLLPDGFQVVRDPVATEVAALLQIKSTPFVLELDRGSVTGKAYLYSAEDFSRLVDARETSDAPELARSAYEVRKEKEAIESGNRIA